MKQLSEGSRIFIFCGPPGSGKGTLSQLCVNAFGWLQLSTGALFRKHRAERTKLGKQIDFAIKSGTLVSDEIVIDIVVQWVEEQYEKKSVMILDGFPRTLVQAENFLKIMQERFFDVPLEIVKFEISDDLVIRRLSSRRVCSNVGCQRIYSLFDQETRPLKADVCDICYSPLMQRDDDKEETIKNRLKTYYYHAASLLEFYKTHQIPIITLDAQESMKTVFDSFISMCK